MEEKIVVPGENHRLATSH